MAKLPRSSDTHRPFRGFPALASGWAVRWKDGTHEARRTVGEARAGEGCRSEPAQGSELGLVQERRSRASSPSVLLENHQAWGALGTSGTIGETGIEARNRRYRCWARFRRPQNSFCCPACRHAPNPEPSSVTVLVTQTTGGQWGHPVRLVCRSVRHVSAPAPSPPVAPRAGLGSNKMRLLRESGPERSCTGFCARGVRPCEGVAGHRLSVG